MVGVCSESRELPCTKHGDSIVSYFVLAKGKIFKSAI